MPITSVAVLGAGTMGHGIAWVAAAAGYDTTLYDVSAEQLEAARAACATLAAGAVERGKLAPEAADAALARLRTETALPSAVRGAEFVIEAVPERMELKLDVLSKVEAFAGPDVVIATNTSALSITEMASILARPGRLAGMHFFNPVPRMKLVEIVRALETSDEAIAVVRDVAGRMGKETIVVRESPGFATSRINAMIGNEAFYMLQEGVASAEDIDKAMKLALNHPMGPFEMADLVGLDTRLSVLEYLHKTLGEKFRPCPLLVQYVRAGRLGRKVGRGVYDYRGAAPAS
jgi:3-hydroxybutyryl-CoA dehydrogenase